MQDRHVIQSGYLSAAIKAEGAELCSLCDATGEEMLWQALPAWPRHAPVLFPIVGRLKDDALHHNGRTYRLTQHGFARDHRFAWLNRTVSSCRLVLHDDAATRAVYPFAFRFEVAFALEDDALVNTFTIINTGREVLPASVGAHPAFRWPLQDGIDKTAHVLEFEHPEPAPIRRLTGGLLGASEPTPIKGSMLALDPGAVRGRRDHPRPTRQFLGAFHCPGCRGDRGILGRIPRARHLDAPGRRLPVHRAVVRHRQPGRLRRRVP